MLILVGLGMVMAVVSLVQGQDATIKVLKSDLPLAEDGKAISGAKLIDNRSVDVQDITMCIRFNYKLLGQYEGRSRLITIEDWRVDEKDSNFQMLWFGAEYPYSFFGFGYPRRHGSYKSWLLKDPETGDFEIWASNRWSHVCFSFRKSDGFIKVVKDGKVMNINYADPAMTGVVFPPNFLSKVYIGRCSFDFKQTCSTPEGQLTDFNMWDRALSLKEMEDWTTCQSMAKGNLVDWTTAKFDVINMTASTQTTRSVCIPPRPGDIIFPEKRNFTAHQALCGKMRGKVSVVQSQEAQDTMAAEFLQHPACGDPLNPVDGRFWAGWWDKPKEGVFSNANDPDLELETGAFQPWYYGEPNGDTLENCAIVWLDRNAWNDIGCNEIMCGFCELERAPDIRIRGLCAKSRFDTKYSWTREYIGGRHSFRGYTDTLLFWDESNMQWRLQLYSDPSIYAVANVSEYPMGTLRWDVIGDPCYDDYHNEITLNINACKDSEFNCVDGYCVSIDERCDGKTDCPDKTDEIGCTILLTDESYLKDVPASPTSEALRKASTTNTSVLAEVSVSVDILSILEISEVDNFISIQLQLWLTWLDRRLIMVNLKRDQDLNTLTSEFIEKIWIPQVVFFNTQEKQESVNDEKAFITIKRNGSFVMSPRSSVHNAFFFSGDENPITVSRVYNAEFLCDFNMAVYPFDTQRCSIILIMKGNTGKFAKLIRNQLRYLGPVDLTQYFVKDTKIADFTVPQDVAAVKVDIVFGRRILAAILTTYLPTILICIVSFSTNYFKAFFFEAVVTVNLTSLLVLTTLFISVSNSLPKTAYIKMIDIWLIFNLFIPFAEVLLHTFIDSLRQEEEREVNHHGSKIKVAPAASESGKADATDVVVNGRVIRVEEAQARMTRRKSERLRPPELIARNESEELEARKVFYDKIEVRNDRHMRFAKKIASQGLPFTFFVFVVIYFAIGMSFYSQKID